VLFVIPDGLLPIHIIVLVQRLHDEHDELVHQLKVRDAATREAAERDFETETRVIRMQQEQLLRSL
jgi:hypothetical protein